MRIEVKKSLETTKQKEEGHPRILWFVAAARRSVHRSDCSGKIAHKGGPDGPAARRQDLLHLDRGITPDGRILVSCVKGIPYGVWMHHTSSSVTC